ncbi:hypothetical protein ACFVAV_27405 [Nocardia sp. NPDC057663]|uniref:hypothetical protein n=1 Tax=Nocardia sp. NPDC057663 TaxID=3346201 RepID=UPI00366E9F21
MKRGITTEAHIVIYCDTCGDRFTGEYVDDPTCAHSMNEAIAQLADSPWHYDGDRVFCGTCLTLAECAAEGRHAFTSQRLIWLLPRPKPGMQHCRRCGISEAEAGDGPVDPLIPVAMPDLSHLAFCCGRRMVFAGSRVDDPYHTPLVRCAECGNCEPDTSRLDSTNLKD